MKLADFVCRDDLCKKGQSRVLYHSDYGVIVKVGRNWWASNDSRWELIGVSSSANLTQPTVGPFKSAKEALAAYKLRKMKVEAT